MHFSRLFFVLGRKNGGWERNHQARKKVLVLVKFPLIGVSGSMDEKETQQFLLRSYTNALMAAEAIPMLLTPGMNSHMMERTLDVLDGVLLAGGNDLAPDLFGEDPVEKLGEVNPLRDQFEMELIRKAFERKMPVFGICRGIQSMNVAMGGTLWQDLPSQYRTADGQPPMLHRQTALACYTTHRVHVEKETVLHSLVKTDEIRVNSFHHQAIKQAAPNLRVTARATDGVIETVECPDHPFFLGVQWHPERYFDRQEEALALFKAFSEAASQYAEGK